MTESNIEDAVLAAYDKYAPSVPEETADRCALAFREGFLAGHTEAESELRSEIARLRGWATAETQHWDGRNADRYWQMQRVLHELGNPNGA